MCRMVSTLNSLRIRDVCSWLFECVMIFGRSLLIVGCVCRCQEMVSSLGCLLYDWEGYHKWRNTQGIYEYPEYPKCSKSVLVSLDFAC